MKCLEGVLVLDLARRYPHALASSILADFGADVVKVDPPGPQFLGRGENEEEWAAYYPLDRNKRSVILDLKQETAREVFLRLVKRADVLIEGFRPGVMGRLGFGFETLSALNPRLIYCAITGFGQDGPYAQLPAHDTNYLAIGGVLSLIGERKGRPVAPSNIIADMAGAGLHGAIGALLALHARERTGKGQLVDIAFMDAAMNLTCFSAADFFRTGVVPKRGEDKMTGAAPYAQVYRCKDGEYFTAAPAEPQFWANFCRILGREDLMLEQDATGERADRIIAELHEIFGTRTRDEWWQLLRDKQTCVGPVYSMDEAFEDPQVKHRQMVVEIEHPTLGPVKQTGLPIKMSDTPGEIHRLGVPSGTDTALVLRELGYDANEIDKLRRTGTFG